MQEIMQEMQFTVLLEGDFASHNYCAYIPELRLNAVGDTKEEALSNIREAVECKITELQEKGKTIKTFSAEILTIRL